MAAGRLDVLDWHAMPPLDQREHPDDVEPLGRNFEDSFHQNARRLGPDEIAQCSLLPRRQPANTRRAGLGRPGEVVAGSAVD
jgi:hypothetical protein